MARYAIGDVQGCLTELKALLAALRFRPDRDQLLFTGDLVNRGPDSLGVLRFVRALGANATTVLGNHDLHLLAHCVDPERPLRRGDTLQPVLEAKDCDALAEWLFGLPLAVHDARHGELLVHAGVIPQWSAADAAAAAAEVSLALREDPRAFLAKMYGNEPSRWRDDLGRTDRLRFTVNCLTRLRFCTAEGRVDLKLKCAPDGAPAPYAPWFSHADRRSAGVRVVFGHWSTLGYLRTPTLLCLDTGCVWGGALTALDLDDPQAEAVRIPCPVYQAVGAD
jgi:bis(5'-nucleosyl)-tetraphosphatase (symmetrical)